MLSFLVFLSLKLIITSAFNSCDCKWYRFSSYGGAATPIGVCTGSAGQASKRECYWNDTAVPPQWEIHETYYTDLECITLMDPSAAPYIQKASDPYGAEFNCDSQNQCPYVTEETYQNSGYANSECIKNAATFSYRNAYVTDCCFTDIYHGGSPIMGASVATCNTDNIGTYIMTTQYAADAPNCVNNVTSTTYTPLGKQYFPSAWNQCISSSNNVVSAQYTDVTCHVATSATTKAPETTTTATHAGTTTTQRADTTTAATTRDTHSTAATTTDSAGTTTKVDKCQGIYYCFGTNCVSNSGGNQCKRCQCDPDTGNLDCTVTIDQNMADYFLQTNGGNQLCHNYMDAVQNVCSDYTDWVWPSTPYSGTGSSRYDCCPYCPSSTAAPDTTTTATATHNTKETETTRDGGHTTTSKTDDTSTTQGSDGHSTTQKTDDTSTTQQHDGHTTTSSKTDDTTTTEEICDPTDDSTKCKGRARDCHKDSKHANSFYHTVADIEEYCAWCICVQETGSSLIVAIEECTYFDLSADGIKQWKLRVIAESLKTFIMESCEFDQIKNDDGKVCTFDDLELGDITAGCACDALQCVIDGTVFTGNDGYRYEVRMIMLVCILIYVFMT